MQQQSLRFVVGSTVYRLAIELAAAKVAAFGVEQIAGNLRERFRLLRGGSRNALPRQQTLRALVDWSFDLLTAQEQDFLTALSVFSGGFTEEAAAFVCVDDGHDDADVFYLLGSLIDKSLVVTDPYGERANRYSLLETIRIYTHDRLVEQPTPRPDMREAREVHARICTPHGRFVRILA